MTHTMRAKLRQNFLENQKRNFLDKKIIRNQKSKITFDNSTKNERETKKKKFFETN